MASAIPNETKRAALAAWLAAATDLRVRLCMDTTTCDSEVDAIVNLADYTLIDASDATGYVDIALTAEAVAVDDPNDRAELDAADVVFTGLSGDATRDYQGVLIYDRIDGTDANDLTGFFVEFTSPITKAATQVTIPWSSEGIAHLT